MTEITPERLLFITCCKQAKELKSSNESFRTNGLTSDLLTNLQQLSTQDTEKLDLLYFLILTKLAEGYEENEQLKFTPATVQIILLILHFHKDNKSSEEPLDPSPFLIIKRILFALKHYHLKYESHVIRASLPILVCKQETSCHETYPVITTNKFVFCQDKHHIRRSIKLDFTKREHCWLNCAQDSLSLIKTMCMIGKDSEEFTIFPNNATTASQESSSQGEIHQDGIIPCIILPPQEEFSLIRQNFWKCTDTSQENSVGACVLRFNGQSLLSSPSYLYFKRGTKFYGDLYSHIIYGVRTHTQGMDENSLYLYNQSQNELDTLEPMDRPQAELKYCGDPCGKWTQAEMAFIDKIVCPIANSEVKVSFDNYHKCEGNQCFDCKWWSKGVELLEVLEEEEEGEVKRRKKSVLVKGGSVGEFGLRIFAHLLPKRLRGEIKELQGKYEIIRGEDFERVEKCWEEDEACYVLKKEFHAGEMF